MSKELERCQYALAALIKELFLLPVRIKDEETLIMFTDIIIKQVESSFKELSLLNTEEENKDGNK